MEKYEFFSLQFNPKALTVIMYFGNDGPNGPTVHEFCLDLDDFRKFILYGLKFLNERGTIIMTSKEALEIIKTDKTLQFHTETKFAVCPSDYYKRELDIIEKDLEVLETLKKYFTYWYIKNSKGFVIEFNTEPVIRLEEEDIDNNYDFVQDFIKIKEWLNNDN